MQYLPSVILFAFSTVIAAQSKAQSTQTLAIGHSGDVAHITPHVEAGKIEIRISGGDGRTSGKPVVITLRNQVASEIYADVFKLNGQFQFSYSIKNRQYARQRIDDWDLVLPAKATTEKVTQPKRWNAATIIAKSSQVGHALDGAETGAILSWYRAFDDAASIEPGETMSGFVLRSFYAPGLVYSYTFGAWPDDSALRDLPLEVTRALEPYLRRESNSNVQITIGPVFAPDTPVEHILATYHRRLSMLRANAATAMRETFLHDLMGLLANARAGLISTPSSRFGLEMLCKRNSFHSSTAMEMERILLQAISLSACPGYEM